MSYTWTTGETITAEKLNNTGGKFGGIIATSFGMGEGSHYFGSLLYARWAGTKWVSEYANGPRLFSYGDYSITSTGLYPLSDDENVKLFWVYYPPELSGITIIRSGAISQTQTAVWVDDGTYEQTGYEITGIAKITFDNG